MSSSEKKARRKKNLDAKVRVNLGVSFIEYIFSDKNMKTSKNGYDQGYRQAASDIFRAMFPDKK